VNNDVKREWFDTDYYKVLGVPESADQTEITKAYRKLARQLPPDANPGDSAAEERFKEVSVAYDVLGDEDRRKQYDQVRRMGPLGGAFGGQGAGGFPGGGTRKRSSASRSAKRSTVSTPKSTSPTAPAADRFEYGSQPVSRAARRSD